MLSDPCPSDSDLSPGPGKNRRTAGSSTHVPALDSFHIIYREENVPVRFVVPARSFANVPVSHRLPTGDKWASSYIIAPTPELTKLGLLLQKTHNFRKI